MGTSVTTSQNLTENELRYRQHFLRQDARSFSIFAGVLLTFYLLLIKADHHLYPTGPVFYGLLSLRLIFVVLAAFTIIRITKSKDPAVFDRWTVVVALYIALTNNLVILSRPATYTGNVIPELIAIIIFFIVLPDKPLYRNLPPLLFASGSLLLFFLLKAPLGTVATLSIVISYGGAIVMGMMISSAFYGYRREAFQALEALKTANRDAHRNEQQYRLLVENSHGIIYEIRPDGCMGFVSSAWTRLLGYSAEQVVGHDFREFVHKEDVAACEAFLHNTVASGEVQRGVIYRVFHADGTMFWHCSNIVPCFNEAHEIISFVGNAVDITEHVLYEAELERRSNELSLLNQTLEQRVEEETERRLRQEKALAGQARLAAMGEMIAAIAHQWRQPLTAVSALVQNVQVAYDCGRLSEEFIRKTVDTALRQCTFMSDTIDEFRGLLQPGKIRTPFNVRNKITTALELITPQLSAHGITTGITGGDSPVITLHGVSGEFKQVILNLVSNAKDAIIERGQREAERAPNGRINIVIELHDGAVHVKVCDNGGGMSPDVMEHIFEPYFTTKAEGHGTGIGLYTCRMIIEGSMGGALTMANCNDGACFTISVPLGEEA